MKTSNFLLSVLGFLGSAFAYPVEDGVLVLDDSNFDDAIKEHEFLLAEFYAPWCGHCKNLAPEYASAAKALANEPAMLAKIDATVATELGSRFEIKGFPTLIFFRSGNKVEYTGGRTSSEIVSWLKKSSGPAAKTLTTADELLALQESGDAVVVGYFNSADSESAKAFVSLAGSDDALEYGISTSDAVKDALALSGETVVVLKPFDDKRADFAVGASFDSAAAATFIAGESTPLIQEFSQAAAKKIFSSPIQKHALFFTDKSADSHSTIMGTFNGVAKDFKGQILVVNVPASEDRVMDYFGIKKDALPSFVFVDMSAGSSMKKYPYSGDLSSATEIAAHISGTLAGTVKPTLKSEPVSPEDTAGDVVVLKGESFNELVMDNDKDVLVEFYAPWCGHCKKLAPTWDELGAKFSAVDSVVIAKMDSTANEVDVDGLVVKGFPTLYFFPGQDKKPVKYESGRELDDFVEYLKENAATKFSHDEL